MSGQEASPPAPVRFGRSRVICCVVPDTGIDRALIRALREDKQIVSATTTLCRGVGILRDVRAAAPVKRGQLPPSELVHLIEVVVPDEEAFALFDYIYEAAGIGVEGGGVMWMGRVIAATPYSLRSDVPDEADG